MNICSFHNFLASVIRPGFSFGFYNAPRPKSHAKTSKLVPPISADFSPFPEDLSAEPTHKLIRFKKIRDIKQSDKVPICDQANDFAFIKTDFTVT